MNYFTEALKQELQSQITGGNAVPMTGGLGSNPAIPLPAEQEAIPYVVPTASGIVDNSVDMQGVIEAVTAYNNGENVSPEESYETLRPLQDTLSMSRGIDQTELTFTESARVPRSVLEAGVSSRPLSFNRDEQGRPVESLVPRPRPDDLKTTKPQEMQEELPSNIDFGFIGAQEGYRTSMYVPKDNDGSVFGRSGPTIGTGVDIGQRSVEDLEGLPEEIINKLAPYTNMSGESAARFVENNPLVLTEEEVATINSWAKQQETNRLISQWEQDSEIPWSSLTTQQATVVASVMYQYGSNRNPETGLMATPRFWRAATSGNWDAVERELRNFGDDYGSRRLREANYLARN